MPIASLLFHDVFLHEPRESGFESAAADRYKLSLAEFDAQLGALAGARRDAPILARQLIESMSVASVTMPYLITVDDGGVSYYTVVADRLEARGWRGHCFVTTNRIGERGFLSAGQIRELDARGHLIGSHSHTHPMMFSRCSIAQMRGEWSRSRADLEDLLGHEISVASVPGGYFSAAVARTAADAGLRILFTSEPTTRPRADHGCLVVGRFTVRPGCSNDFAGRIVLAPGRTRRAAWAGWNAKKAVKPLLGAAYARVADWWMTPRS
jgi:peptidoglycan/xylan/chitin deacetylase (PgdA/CDA1 family)